MFTLQNPSQIELKMLTLFMMHRQLAIIITCQIWWQTNTKTVIIKYTNTFYTVTQISPQHQHLNLWQQNNKKKSRGEMRARQEEAHLNMKYIWFPVSCMPGLPGPQQTVQMSTWLPVLWMRLKIEFAISCWGFCNVTLSHTSQPPQTGCCWCCWCCSIGPDCSTPFNE